VTKTRANKMKRKEEHINKRAREKLLWNIKLHSSVLITCLLSAEIYNTSNTKKPFDALADECRNVHAYNSRRNMQLAWRNVTLFSLSLCECIKL
jgi:hypothetical protein